MDVMPEPFLLLALIAEQQGNLERAIWSIKRALYLCPGFILGHAMLVAFFHGIGNPAEAERSRWNALELLADVDDSALIAGFEPVSASTLRQALESGS